MREERLAGYKYLIDEAIDIVDQMGTEKYIEGYYNDEYIGKEFNYEDFKIVLNEGDKRYRNADINIYIKDICVFNYTFNSNYVNIIEGKWIDIINCLYDYIPEYIQRKEKEKQIIIQKQKQLFSLREDINFFLDNFKPKTSTRGFIHQELYKRNITVKQNSTSFRTHNILDNEDEETDSYYSIYWDGKEVMRFRCTSHLRKEDLIDFQDKFKPGEWINDFIDAIDATKDYIYETNQDRVEFATDEIIKKLNKKLYK